MKHKKTVGLVLYFSLSSCLLWAEPGVKIEKVWPEKLVNRTNSEAIATVTLVNESETEQDVRLVCELLTGLENTEIIFDNNVKIPSKNTISLPVKFNTGDREWGIAVQAKLLDNNGKVLSKQDEVFAISDNIFKVSVGYTFIHSGRNYGEAGLKQIAADRRSAYWPVVEWYAGLHSEVAYLQWGLDMEKWIAGGRFPESKSTMRAFIDALHQQGLGIVIYNIPAVTGPAGVDFAREHPDWLIYTDGRPAYINLNVESIDKLRNPDISMQERDACYEGTLTYTNVLFTNPAVMDYMTEQIIQAAKYFGFDGIRWDGYPMLASTETVFGGVNPAGTDYKGAPLRSGISDQDAWNEANIARMNNRISKELPNFIFGNNWSPEYGGISWPDELPKTFRITAKEALVMDEDLQTRDQTGSAIPSNLWERYRQRIVRGADLIRGAGGYHSTTTLVAGTNIFNRHMNSIIYAGASNLGIFSGFEQKFAEAREFYRFALRYCEFLYNHSMERIKDLDKVPAVEVKNDGSPLWWKEYVYRGRLKDGKEYLVTHLVNPPVKPYMDYNEAQQPKEQANIEVLVNSKFSGEINKAYILSPDIPENKILLPLNKEGDIVKVIVPKLTYWDMIVFECR
ncbi:MAG: hypothetical protein HY350_04335 [Candidatus Omnitrophica bacterium]|nr:hypothetical protein [Candidatus Omnitrophota bacterium]